MKLREYFEKRMEELDRSCADQLHGIPGAKGYFFFVYIPTAHDPGRMGPEITDPEDVGKIISRDGNKCFRRIIENGRIQNLDETKGFFYIYGKIGCPEEGPEYFFCHPRLLESWKEQLIEEKKKKETKRVREDWFARSSYF